MGFLFFRLLSRLECEESGEIEVNILYESYKFEVIESGNQTVSSKNTFIDHLKLLFPDIKRARKKVGDVSQTVYRGVKLKPLTQLNVKDITFNEIPEVKPSFYDLKSSSAEHITFEISTSCTSNGNRVSKTLQFNKNRTFEVYVASKKVDLESIMVSSIFEYSRSSILNVFCIVEKIRLCNGMKYATSHILTRFHTLDMWKVGNESFKSIRHASCMKIVQFNSKTFACRVCQKMIMFVNKENQDKRNIEQRQEPEIPLKTKSDQIRELFPNAPNKMLNNLLEQSLNVSRSPKGRRWSKEFIATCLQLFNRSPKCYEMFQQSKLMLLPSKSVLILYRNALKQDPGFDPKALEWMHEEANRLGLSSNDRLGGVIFDEMTIQQDIQLEKNGSVLEFTGFTDLGREGDMCNQLRKGAVKSTMGTHILQLLFLGINGFRFPFAFFITDTVQASEIYSLFWKAVAELYTYGFKVLFTCMDGAQANRTFMHICVGKEPKIFSTPSPCTSHPVILMMDFSHVMKKIRNNLIQSGIHEKCTRLLTLPTGVQIQWQMFIDFFRWDQQNGLQLHRKLTNEHLFPDKQLKMRNHLAEDILNKEMLHSMKIYQQSLGEKGKVLDGAVELLEQTSTMIKIFRDMKPIREVNDERLLHLSDVNQWFQTWETKIHQSDLCKTDKTKSLFSYQCHEDIHSCIQGFIQLCEQVFKMNTCLYVTPGIINSDVIENIFNQQRSTYNGANTNPTVLQYKKTINNILVGQGVISHKSNAGTSAALPFPIAVPNTNLRNRKHHSKAEESGEKPKIKVIRM